MKKHTDSVDAAILDRIQSRGPGYVHSPADFLDLGTRATVDQALSRNGRAGTLRKVGRGLYDLPKDHPMFGPLSTSSDAVVQAIARREGIRLQPSGAHLANALGLSDQVPVKAVYMTDGRTRRIRLGKVLILLKHASPRAMATAGTISGHVIQALRWMGKRHMDEAVINHLRRNLSADQKSQLMGDLHYAPAWTAEIMRRIAVTGKD